jgi:hypothetical protein
MARVRPPAVPVVTSRLFAATFVALSVLAAAPFWRTRLLPMQDYPQLLVFARVYGDCHDPSSPFFGTYTTGFPLSPLLLPILMLRAMAAVSSLETAGRVMWTLYALGLPLASLYLLRVLGRDRWATLLVFPLVFSYWSGGGFFAFATSAPLLVLGLALGVRWLEAPSGRRGAAFATALCALHLWHSLSFAQLLLDFGVLWLLHRAEDGRARLRALLPLAPSLALFAVWMLVTLKGRPPGSRPPSWPPFFDNAGHFFDFIGPILPAATALAVILSVILLAGALARTRPASDLGAFRVDNPFGLLSLLAVVSYLVLPSACFGVEGINNRQPWIAALLLVFGWTLPARPGARAALLALVGGVGVLVLVQMGQRFAAFSRESEGASRLIDRLRPGETLLAPIGSGATPSFPSKPLIALELYATIRHGGLPNSSFAGYDYNLIRYVGGKNPMPGLGANWLGQPGLARFDYVLLRGPTGMAAAKPGVIRSVAHDGEWSLFAVCGGRALPSCP